MTRSVSLTAGFVLCSLSAFAGEPAVPTLAIDNVHLRVADPAKASEWYVRYAGATTNGTPPGTVIGKTVLAFVKTDKAQPSAGSVIDHIGLSYANLDAKIKEFEAGGAKIVNAPREIPGLFKIAFIEDPWGVKIELVQDPQALGFHHIHLSVRDPQATLGWYEDMFGGQREKLKGQIDGLRYGSVWLLAAKNNAEPAPSADRAIQNLAFGVANMDSAAKAMKGRSVKTVIEPTALRNLWYAFFEDTNGVRIELIQR